MCEMYIMLQTIASVKKFVTKISAFDEDCELISGRYVIDAKSLIGIFSMDLSKKILLRIHAKGERLEQIKEAIREFAV